MATKKMNRKKEVAAIEVTSLEVISAREYEDIFFFDMVLNGGSIYCCRLIEGEEGWFISFPSKKPDKKGGKWFNHCWAKLPEDAIADICAAVFEMCGVDED